MVPPVDKANPRVDPPLQPETSRALWIGWGANGLSLAFQFIVGGLFFGYLFLCFSIAMVFRGWKPGWFATHIDEQIIAGTPYRREESMRVWSVVVLACLLLAWTSSSAQMKIAPEKPNLAKTVLEGMKKLLEEKQVSPRPRVTAPAPAPILTPTLPQQLRQKTNEYFQAETFRDLRLAIQPAPEGHNALDTGFTVINNGQSSIGKHSILCIAYQLVGGTNIGTSIYGQEGGSDAPIQGSGDSQTDFCLARINQLRAYATVDCIDLLVTFNYSLEIQPNIMHGKAFRFGGIGGKSKTLTWYPERVADSNFFCSALIEKTMHQP
jgi:hypothetical protein